MDDKVQSVLIDTVATNSKLRTIHAMSEPMATDYSQVPITQCAYQLSLEMHRLVGGFPKQLRFQLGGRLATAAQDFLERVIQANFIRDPRRRSEALADLPGALFTMRMSVRLAKDLKAISMGQWTETNVRLEDLQKQLAGWSRWTQSKVATPGPAPASGDTTML